MQKFHNTLGNFGVKMYWHLLKYLLVIYFNELPLNVDFFHARKDYISQGILITNRVKNKRKTEIKSVLYFMALVYTLFSIYPISEFLLAQNI